MLNNVHEQYADLQAKVEELTAELNNHDYKLGKTVKELQAKIDELKQERNLAWDKGYSVGRDDAHQTIVALQAKVAQLSAKVLYGLRRYEALSRKVKNE